MRSGTMVCNMMCGRHVAANTSFLNSTTNHAVFRKLRATFSITMYHRRYSALAVTESRPNFAPIKPRAPKAIQSNYNFDISRLKHFSTTACKFSEIPEDPAFIKTGELIINELSGLSEPLATTPLSEVCLDATFSELGLASPYTPVGWIQTALESLHVTCDLPWWACIAVITVCLRLATFPLVVVGRRHMINMHNHAPHMVDMQRRITAARLAKNSVEATVLTMELDAYLRRHQVRPVLATCMPFLHSPVFVSMFLALRGVANTPVGSLTTGGVPVPSLTTGGALWFPDLTVPDPLHLLPFITAGTLLLVVELAADTGVKTQQTGMVKNVLRVLPLVTIPFALYLPTAVVSYWFWNNSLTLLQAVLLQNPRVREALGIPKSVPPPAPATPKSKSQPGKGFVESLYESLSNANVASEIQDRQRVGALTFDKKKATKE